MQQYLKARVGLPRRKSILPVYGVRATSFLSGCSMTSTMRRKNLSRRFPESAGCFVVLSAFSVLIRLCRLTLRICSEFSRWDWIDLRRSYRTFCGRAS